MSTIKTVVVLSFLFTISFLFLSCDESVDSDRYTITKICIEGHYYYYASGIYSGGIAPVLTDDGKPCPCEVKH